MGKNPFPNRPIEVRLAASKKGVEVRQKRAGLKKQIKRGQISVIDILRDPPDYAMKIRALDLIRSVSKIGNTRARKIMQECGIHERRRIQGLGSKQKERLVNYLK